MNQNNKAVTAPGDAAGEQIETLQAVMADRAELIEAARDVIANWNTDEGNDLAHAVRYLERVIRNIQGD